MPIILLGRSPILLVFTMFSRIKELAETLVEGDFANYNNSSKTRKHLKSIQVEADKLRKDILSICKASNPKLFKIEE